MSEPRNVLVTAAASGIGLAIARAFAANGDRVMVCDVDEAALSDLAVGDPTIAGELCNVAERADVERLMGRVADTLGGLDVFVNNAGIAGPTAPVEDLDPREWDAVVAVNLTAAFDFSRLAIPLLKRSGGGSIIVMSSVAGRYGYPNRSAYAATKWGLIGFTKSLAIELGEYGIRANAILPGGVDGPRLRRVLEGRAQASGRPVEEVTAEALEAQSIKRFVDPDEVAALALFLASEHGRSISGQMLPIDNDSSTA